MSDIDKIVFTRDTSSGAKSYSPLGFNNFNPTSATIVPEPSTALLVGLGLAIISTRKRSRIGAHGRLSAGQRSP